MTSPDWHAPAASGRLDATVTLPGSKSLTNRYLVLAALASDTSRLRRPLRSRDTELMAQALRQLGASIDDATSTASGSPDWIITPATLRGGRPVDCGLAGTVMRFLPPLAAGARGTVAFDGDPQARARPLGTVLDALRGLGLQPRRAGAEVAGGAVRGVADVVDVGLPVAGVVAAEQRPGGGEELHGAERAGEALAVASWRHRHV